MTYVYVSDTYIRLVRIEFNQTKEVTKCFLSSLQTTLISREKTGDLKVLFVLLTSQRLHFLFLPFDLKDQVLQWFVRKLNQYCTAYTMHHLEIFEKNKTTLIYNKPLDERMPRDSKKYIILVSSTAYYYKIFIYLQENYGDLSI